MHEDRRYRDHDADWELDAIEEYSDGKGRHCKSSRGGNRFSTESDQSLGIQGNENEGIALYMLWLFSDLQILGGSLNMYSNATSTRMLIASTSILYNVATSISGPVSTRHCSDVVGGWFGFGRDSTRREVMQGRHMSCTSRSYTSLDMFSLFLSQIRGATTFVNYETGATNASMSIADCSLSHNIATSASGSVGVSFG